MVLIASVCMDFIPSIPRRPLASTSASYTVELGKPIAAPVIGRPGLAGHHDELDLHTEEAG